MKEQAIKEKAINFLDYIFDRLIAGNLKALFHFLVNEIVEKVIIKLLDKTPQIISIISVVMSMINSYYVIHNIQTINGVYIVINFSFNTLALVYILLNNGKINIDKINLLKNFKKNGQPEKDN